MKFTLTMGSPRYISAADDIIEINKERKKNRIKQILFYFSFPELPKPSVFIIFYTP